MPKFDEVSTRRLLAACSNNDINQLQTIHNEGYPVSTATFGENNSTLLHLYLAGSNVQLAFVKKLIELGSRLDAVNSYNSTPLHIAASNSENDPNTQAKIIAYLVRKGANLEAQDIDGDKPMGCALKNENAVSAKIFYDTLVEAEAYVESVKNSMIKIQGATARQKYFNDAMENDVLYEKMISGSATKTKSQERGFAAKEEQRRAGQTTANPIMVSLVANGGFTEAVLKQQEEKKKQKCCIIT